MKSVDSQLQKQFLDATEEIKNKLPQADRLSLDECRAVIQRYAAAIEGNFIAWMGAAEISARSIEGRFAAGENLFVELKDDHAGMLHEFARSAHSLPQEEHFEAVHSVVDEVRQMVGEMSGIKTLTLMAMLETSSCVFVPWLAQLAKKCGSTNLKYIDVHGEADVAHAERFLLAVDCERAHHTASASQIANALEISTRFILTALRPSN